MTETAVKTTACPEKFVPTEVTREFNRAMDEGHRARVAGNDTDLEAARVRVEAAEAKMKPCVVDAPHEPPHRAADGTEWGHPPVDPQEVLMEAVDAALLRVAEGETEAPDDLVAAARDLVAHLRAE